MSDECCGPAIPRGAGEATDDVEEPTPWWRDRALALPLAAGVLWVTGLLLEQAGLGTVALIAYAIGLAAGAWTFAPGAMRRVVTGRGQGRLGVGLLMTIAATGAVIYGFVVGKIAATFAAPMFPKYVLLVPGDSIIGFFVVLGICIVSSLVSIRMALRVDPAEAIGG